MKRKTFYSINEDGELVEEAISVIIQKKAACYFEEGFMIANIAAMNRIAETVTSAQTLRVMFALMSKLDYENMIHVNQAALAKQLKMQRTNVNRAIKALIEEHGVIEHGPLVNGVTTYRMNPEIAWRGSAKAHKKALAEQRGFKVIDGGKTQ